MGEHQRMLETCLRCGVSKQACRCGPNPEAAAQQRRWLESEGQIKRLEEENAYLRRALDQAIRLGMIHLDFGYVHLGPVAPYNCDSADEAPDLAKYLKEKKASDAK